MRSLSIKHSALILTFTLFKGVISNAAADIGPPREDPCLSKKEGDSCSWLPFSNKKCRWETFTQGKDEDPNFFERYSGRWQKCEALPSTGGLLRKRCLSCSDSELEEGKDKPDTTN
jgi:hypothetical protein